jgi:hypothetical protein
LIKLKKLRLVLSLVMLSLIVSVVSVSERCYAGPEEEARTAEEAWRVEAVWRAKELRLAEARRATEERQIEEERAQASLMAAKFARTLELELKGSTCCACCPGGTREKKLNWVIRVIPTRPKEQANASPDYLEYVKEQLKKECV